MDVYDYETANKLLESNKKFKRRMVANNTWIERSRTDDSNAICLILHQTAILTYYEDGDIYFDTDGWSSSTTIDRMNRFQRKIKIWRHKKLWWFVEMGLNNYMPDRPFCDRILVKSNGEVIVPEIKDQVESKNFGYLMGMR